VRRGYHQLGLEAHTSARREAAFDELRPTLRS
jgi:hypothetical protein